MVSKHSQIRVFSLIALLFTLLLCSCNQPANPLLTESEKNWLKKNQEGLEVLFGYQAPPNAFHDSDGNYKGLLVDFLGVLEKQLGFTFTYRYFEHWNDLIEYSKTGHNFVVVGIAKTDARSKYLIFTDPFIKVPYVIVTTKSSNIRSINDLTDKKLCTVANYAVNDYLAKHYPELQPHGVNDNLEGLRGVSTGRYDAMILNQMYGSYIIENQGITNLTIAGESGYLNRLSAAVSIQDPIFFSIIDKCIDQIPPTLRRSLYRKWLGQEERPISPAIIFLFLGIFVIGTIAFSALWFWNRSLNKQVVIRTREIAKSREKLQTTLHSIGDGVITTDTEGKIQAMNPVATQLTGWTEREAFGQPLADVFNIVHTITGETVDSPVAKVLSTNQIVALADHTTLVAKGGEQFRIADSGAPIQDKSGTCFGVVLVFRDITRQKQVEEELLKMQKLNSISTMAGGIAHDFNNILTGLYGNISLARETLSPDHPSFQAIEIAEQSFDRAKRLANQLLTFSKKGGEPVQQKGDVGELVREVINLDLAGSNVLAEIDCAADLWLAEIDKGQIQQVFTNLTINAIQAMPDGGKLRISLQNEQIKEGSELFKEGHRYIKITLNDNGPGIKAEHLANIFDPYFSTKQNGSGLGLATSYSIIQRHCGHIQCNSSLGQGATFTIYLPAAKDQSREKIEQKSTELPPEVVEDLKILVMDDEEVIRGLLVHMLTPHGFKVGTAEDGDRAIAMYKEAVTSGSPYDIIILDLTVPGGTGGLETARQIRAEDADARIIVSSGYTEAPLMTNPSEGCFDDIMPKPYTTKELLKVLGRVMNSPNRT